MSMEVSGYTMSWVGIIGPLPRGLIHASACPCGVLENYCSRAVASTTLHNPYSESLCSWHRSACRKVQGLPGHQVDRASRLRVWFRDTAGLEVLGPPSRVLGSSTRMGDHTIPGREPWGQ